MGAGLYFDYCATTPLHPQVREAILSVLDDNFGNPSSMHGFGRQARSQVENARTQVAAGIGASPDEIIFTSGATEANNLAITGTLRRLAPVKNHLIISAIEHHAVLHTAEALADEGFQLTILPVDRQGMVSADSLANALRPETALVSIMMVNNEVGTLQNISQLATLAKEKDTLFHTDAVQGVPYLEVDVKSLGIDFLSLSAHKMYGPKGVGVLYLKSGTPLKPMLIGGAQERKLRPGTENVPGIVGLGKAMELRTDDLSQRRSHISSLRSTLIQHLKETIPGVQINGPDKNISPHVISASFPNVDGEMMLFHLSQKNIAVSLGSACTSEDLEPSHVLTAMNLPLDQVEGTLRISLGDPTTEAEINELLKILPKVIELSKLD
jgi:cysteine desulfurase